MLKILLILIFVAVAGSAQAKKDEVTYPDENTAVRNGIVYKVKKKAKIYEDIDEAKDNNPGKEKDR